MKVVEDGSIAKADNYSAHTEYSPGLDTEPTLICFAVKSFFGKVGEVRPGHLPTRGNDGCATMLYRFRTMR